MKIKLINPGQLDPLGQPVSLYRELIPGLTLPYLAALFPAGHEIEIIEEGLEPLDYDEQVDLVGITAMTSRAPRGYHIAERFRRRGVPVVMGGFHASALPEEALQYCDAVVQGEAEGLMEQIVADAAAGNLHGIYRRDEPSDLTALPAPRYDLLKMKNYIGHYYPVQVTRGCPYHCEFCSVSGLYKGRYRKRPLDDVIMDMKQAGPVLFIVDDNLSADKEYALALFEQMKSLNKLWGGQFNLAAANDVELVKAAAAAGCMFLYVGVETVDAANLESSKKRMNLGISAKSAVRNMKKHNIDPLVSMIVGFEHDDTRTAQRIVNFCNSARVPLLLLYVLTPLPGSPLYNRLAGNEIKLPRKWHLYDGTHALMNTENMSAEEIDAMYASIYQELFTLPSILRRTLAPPRLILLMLNLVSRRDFKNSLHPWMGTSNKKRLGTQLAPLIMNLLNHSLARRILRLVHYAESRISK